MRICFISHATSHFTRAYVDYFANRGDEVHLVSLVPRHIDNSINHHPLPQFSFDGLRTLRYGQAIPRVRAIVKRINPSVVHAHYLTSNGLLAALSGCRPLIVSAHGSDLHRMWNPLRRAAAAYALRHSDLVNPVARHQQTALLRLGATRSQLLPLSQGVQSHRFAVDRSRPRPGIVRLICTRRLEGSYDPTVLVEALSALKQRGPMFHCTFAGSGSQQAALAKECASRGLSDRVTFLGGYGQDELPRLLEQADVYVSPAPNDGASVSLLEGMSSGLFPVVADIPGNREWISGNRDGLLFPRGNAAALAEALHKAIEDTELRRGAIGFNRQRIELQGERDANLGQLADAYASLIETYRRA